MSGVGASASLGALLALLSALSWGGGDFAGGMGAKAAGGTVRGVLRMLLAAHGISLLAVGALSLWLGHPPIRGWPVVWGLFCGVVAGTSLTAFYVALARGAMGGSAAISGLLAAALPAAVGIVLEGRPTALRCVGFALAGIAIPMIALPAEKAPQPKARGTLWLAVGGGIGFGLYFTGLKFANSLGVLEPFVLARAGSVATCAVLLAVVSPRQHKAEGTGTFLSRMGWLWAAVTAVLDTGGNLLYIAATRVGRLDVAAVLASLYPASTILLAAWILRERPGRRQMAGMAAALAAAVLVTL